ncbi:hypothetical protein AQUCO_02200174v1 [Aquilegia coerulea]|uniref:F-box domain-containing protein n=1 Tax=Aquilegia coerulea TaxID=218851 RepID=A0A2G5DDJ4_AQUCA|nr:hypothetical protein AQUCO_02200174v1 [Aquilegia coerulea]
MADYGGADRISSLPDSVLCYIIGFLPILEVVRTCILSHRCESLWKSVPSLNFEADSKSIMKMVKKSQGTNTDDDDLLHERYMLYSVGMKPNLLNIITKVLNSHCGTVDSCLIKYYLQKDLGFTRLVGWIEKLLKLKKIRKLTLICYNESSSSTSRFSRIKPKENNFRSGLFSFETLNVLELNGCEINNASPFKGCSNLCILILKNLILTGETFQEIVSICVNLEKLILQKIYSIRNLKVIHDSLKMMSYSHGPPRSWSSHIMTFHFGKGKIYMIAYPFT